MRLPSLPYTIGIAVPLAWGGFISAVMLGTLFTYLPAGDFGAFYSSAESFWSGLSLYTPHPYLNLNPPHASVLLFSPLLLADMQTAAAVWVGVNVVCAGLSLAVIRSEVGLSATRFVAIVAVLVASEPWHGSLNGGQMGGLMMPPVTLAWRAHRRGQWSVWLAVATSVKPWLAPIILFQRPRHAAATIGLGLAGLVVGVLVLGVEEWRAWLTALGQFSERAMPGNVSILSASLMVSNGSPLARPIWAGLSVALVGMTVLSKRDDPDRDWLLAGLVGVLVSPLGWTYYLLALVGPLVGWGERHHWPTASLVAVCGLLVPAPLLVGAYNIGLTPLAVAYTAALLLLWRAAMTSGTVDLIPADIHQRPSVTAERLAVPAGDANLGRARHVVFPQADHAADTDG